MLPNLVFAHQRPPPPPEVAGLPGSRSPGVRSVSHKHAINAQPVRRQRMYIPSVDEADWAHEDEAESAVNVPDLRDNDHLPQASGRGAPAQNSTGVGTTGAESVSLTQAKQDLAKKDAEIEMLRAKVSSQDVALKAAKGSLIESKVALGELSAQVRTSNKRTSDLETALEASNEELVASRLEIASMTMGLLALRESMEAIEGDLGELMTSVQNTAENALDEEDVVDAFEALSELVREELKAE